MNKSVFFFSFFIVFLSWTLPGFSVFSKTYEKKYCSINDRTMLVSVAAISAALGAAVYWLCSAQCSDALCKQWYRALHLYPLKKIVSIKDRDSLEQFIAWALQVDFYYIKGGSRLMEVGRTLTMAEGQYREKESACLTFCVKQNGVVELSDEKKTVLVKNINVFRVIKILFGFSFSDGKEEFVSQSVKLPRRVQGVVPAKSNVLSGLRESINVFKALVRICSKNCFDLYEQLHFIEELIEQY